jgi:hypothetical protein
MHLQAFRKCDGEKQWSKCPEMVKLLPETLLPGYTARTEFCLPPVLQVEADGAAGGEETGMQS